MRASDVLGADVGVLGTTAGVLGGRVVVALDVVGGSGGAVSTRGGIVDVGRGMTWRWLGR